MSQWYTPEFGMSFGSRWTRAIKVLISVNVSVFILQLLFYTISSRWGGVEFVEGRGLGYPDPFTKLFWFYPPDAFGRLWLWQFFSYTSLHSIYDPWHLIINMFALWMFGADVERTMGTRKFLTLYFSAGFFAALLSSLLSHDSALVGASGAVFAVEVAFAMFFPEATIILFIFPIKAKHLVMIFAGITALNCLLPTGGNVAYYAHIGGLLYGFLFVRYEPMLWEIVSLWQARQREKKIKESEDIRRKVDMLLEKVNRVGMENLTKKELEFLQNASKKYKKWKAEKRV
ncbi:MAG TPA: rhomboid family intramembrane serine protease [Candidatus Hypogeohydataceae bacterium YC38]|nr:rhomboid family intramembrane serine protease [Candidatus Brocadiales bacterium]